MEQLKQSLPGVMQGAGTAMSVIGGFNKASAYDRIAANQVVGADMTATQLEDNAKTAAGIGQQAAIEQERQGRVAMSRALAVAAASGGGASDPTVMNIISRLAGESHLRAMTALYEGDDQARNMRNAAVMTRYSGEVAATQAKQAASASRFGAFTTAMTGAASMFEKYGKKTPAGTQDLSLYEQYQP